MKCKFELQILDENKSKPTRATTLEHDIVIALDEADIRPISIVFVSSTHFYVSYGIDGYDLLNSQANSIRFFKNAIEPCIQECLDTVLGRKDFSVRLDGYMFQK